MGKGDAAEKKQEVKDGNKNKRDGKKSDTSSQVITESILFQGPPKEIASKSKPEGSEVIDQIDSNKSSDSSAKKRLKGVESEKKQEEKDENKKRKDRKSDTSLQTVLKSFPKQQQEPLNDTTSKSKSGISEGIENIDNNKSSNDRAK